MVINNHLLPFYSALTQPLQIFLFLCSVIAAMQTQALTAKVDRQTVPLNESFQLALRSSHSRDLDQIDFSPIEKHFAIVSRSSQSEFSIVNGRTESVQRLTLMLAPTAVGNFTIPALSHKGYKSHAIDIIVTPAIAPPDQMDDQSIVIEAELDKSHALVGEQLIYTFRVLYRVNLNSPQITNLDIPNASVQPLEDRNFRRQINGLSYQVAEKRYAIHVQQPGVVNIEGQVLTALLDGSTTRRFGFGFDPFSRGEQVRLAAESLSLTIAEPPAGIDRAQWLPAQSVTLHEEWSADNNEVAVGEPVTRSVEIFAKGLAAEQLPAISETRLPGLNSYPEMPEFINQEWTGGIAGKRIETFALIPTTTGSYELPAIEVIWWNTTTRQAETAVLPARTLTVIADNSTASEPLGTLATTVNSEPGIPLPSIAAIENTTQTASANTWWKPAAIAAVIAWLLTLSWAMYLKRLSLESVMQRASNLRTEQSESIARQEKQLLKACQNNNAKLSKTLLNRWLIAQAGQLASRGHLSSQAARQPDEVVRLLNHRPLTKAIAALNIHLFGRQQTTEQQWDGAALSAAIRSLAKQSPQNSATLPPLYPTQAA